LLGSVRLVGGVGLVGPLGLLCLRAITTFLPLLDGRGVGLLKVQNVENVRQRGFDLLPRRTVAEHQPKTLGEDGLLMREATSNDLELQRMVAIGELVVGVANVVEHELHGNVAVGAVVPQGRRHEVGVEQDAVAMRGDRVAVRREVDRSSVLHLFEQHRLLEAHAARRIERLRQLAQRQALLGRRGRIEHVAAADASLDLVDRRRGVGRGAIEIGDRIDARR